MLLAQHFLHLGQDGPRVMESRGQGDVILAIDSPTSSAVASRAVWGLCCLCVPTPAPSLAEGTRANTTWCCCCTQGTASPRQFCISPPETSTFPLFTIPGKAWGLYYILLYFPFQKTVTGSFSTSATPRAKSIPSFSFLPGEVTGAGNPPCIVPWQ